MLGQPHRGVGGRRHQPHGGELGASGLLSGDAAALGTDRVYVNERTHSRGPARTRHGHCDSRLQGRARGARRRGQVARERRGRVTRLEQQLVSSDNWSSKCIWFIVAMNKEILFESSQSYC